MVTVRPPHASDGDTVHRDHDIVRTQSEKITQRRHPATASPVPVPTVPLPTITLPPVPTLPPLPTPTLPVPTPSLPVPTPTVSFAPPSLPVGTAAPSASPSPTALITGSSPGPSAVPSGDAPAGILLGASPGPDIGASPPPVNAGGPAVDGGADSFLEGLVVPGLLVGVPTIILLGILAAQLAVGAAWLPVIRRWLHRRV